MEIEKFGSKYEQLPEISFRFLSSEKEDAGEIASYGILDAQGTKVGSIDIFVYPDKKQIMAGAIDIGKEGLGYASAVYRKLYELYPGWMLVSPGVSRTDIEGRIEKIWDRLVTEEKARKEGDDYYMQL